MEGSRASHVVFDHGGQASICSGVVAVVVEVCTWVQVAFNVVMFRTAIVGGVPVHQSVLTVDHTVGDSS